MDTMEVKFYDDMGATGKYFYFDILKDKLFHL